MGNPSNRTGSELVDRAASPGGPRATASRISARGVLAVTLALVIAAVCIRLGFWQLDRLDQRRSRNAAIEASLALPPLDLDSDGIAALQRDPGPFQFRRVRARGVYASEAEVVQRGRSYEGRPGVYLLTPLRINGTQWSVLVNRGWAPSPDALSLDPRPLAEPGVREVEGIVELFPHGVREDNPLEHIVDDVRVFSIQRLDPRIVQQRLSTPLLTTAYVLQVAGDDVPSGIQRLPIPAASEGPHLGYAVQWFSFAAIAVIGLIVLWIRARRGSS